MNVNPEMPQSNLRDRLVLSKGHASAALYAVLAERGFINKEDLKTFRKLGSNLQGHPDMEKVPGVDMSTGSLGQGLSIANGMAIASKMDNLGCRVYCILGDGEIEEGQIWEAAMTSNKYELDNLCVILDNNGLQIDGKVEEVKALDCLYSKWESFGFNVIACDGHNIDMLIDSFEKARQTKGQPSIIIARTVKGKGVPFMENKAEWHGKAPNDEQYEKAMKALKLEKEKIEHNISELPGKEDTIWF
jgi:transketolase